MQVKSLIVDENNKLFDKKGMFYKEFNSDFRQVRYYTLLIVQKAPEEIKEINLLSQQISELIKNAIKHGNKSDPDKIIKVWYYFDTEKARIIVEDEGEGFKDLEKWNEFNRKRIECFANHNFEDMEKYVSFRSKTSDESDGGNAMFAALEYWNGGVIFNNKKNAVSVLKTYQKKRRGIDLVE
jgi:serine/threonine-protein kinase RsbW